MFLFGGLSVTESAELQDCGGILRAKGSALTLQNCAATGPHEAIRDLRGHAVRGSSLYFQFDIFNIFYLNFDNFRQN